MGLYSAKASCLVDGVAYAIFGLNNAIKNEIFLYEI